MISQTAHFNTAPVDSLSLGLSLYQAGRLDEAQVALEAALAAAPASAEALLTLGCVHLEAGRPAPAAFYFTRALRQDPDNAVLLFHLSDCQAAMGEFALAAQTATHAMAAWENNGIAVTKPSAEAATADLSPIDLLFTAIAPLHEGYSSWDAFIDSVEVPFVSAPPPVVRRLGTAPLRLGTGMLKSA